MEKLDTALICLVTMAKIMGIPADEQQMRRAYVVGDAGMDTIMLIRAAKELGIKSRLVEADGEKFSKLPLPAIAILKNDTYVIVLKNEDQFLTMIDPYQPQVFRVPVRDFLERWSGQVILMTRRFILKEIDTKFGLGWFVPIIMRYKRIFINVLFISFILQGFGLVSPLFTQVVIDKVLVHRSLDTLDILVLGMIIVNIFQVWITGLRGYIFTHTTNKIDVVLSTKLFRHITSLPIKYFEQWQVGDVVSRVRELEQVRGFITGSSLTVVLDVVFAIVYVGVMFTYSSTLTIVTLGTVLVYIILNLIVTPIYRRLLTQLFYVSTETQSFLIETITGIQTVKSLATESHFVQRWEQMLARLVKTSFATANLANVAGNIGSFIQQIFNLSVLWMGAHAVLAGTLSVGELIAFQMLAGQVIAPILRLVNMWQSFQKTMVSVDRLGDIMNDAIEPAFNPNRTTLPSIRGEIVIDRMTFRYRNDGNEVLHQIKLNIPAGSRIGIVGRSGSGKSTLTKLIQRLYVPESGQILIDGVDLAQVEPAWLRRQIGVVLQENYLFNGSVRENIAAANQNATFEEIEYVAKISGADEFIHELPEGYNTVVGERGSSLSGGQRQRIAIARALLTNPRVLIFDEATSALDYESERAIMDNLDAISAGRTMIMIAHRLSTVRRSDQIIVIDRGKVAEQGSHEELLAQKGVYYSLYTQQEV